MGPGRGHGEKAEGRLQAQDRRYQNPSQRILPRPHSPIIAPTARRRHCGMRPVFRRDDFRCSELSSIIVALQLIQICKVVFCKAYRLRFGQSNEYKNISFYRHLPFRTIPEWKIFLPIASPRSSQVYDSLSSMRFLRPFLLQKGTVIFLESQTARPRQN